MSDSLNNQCMFPTQIFDPEYMLEGLFNTPASTSACKIPSHSMISIHDQLLLPVAEKETESDQADHSSNHSACPPTLGMLSLDSQNKSSIQANSVTETDGCLHSRVDIHGSSTESMERADHVNADDFSDLNYRAEIVQSPNASQCLSERNLELSHHTVPIIITNTNYALPGIESGQETAQAVALEGHCDTSINYVPDHDQFRRNPGSEYIKPLNFGSDVPLSTSFSVELESLDFLDSTVELDSSDIHSNESHTTDIKNSEKTITCEPSVAAQDPRSLNSAGTILADEGIYKELASLDGHAEIEQDPPTITTSFCNGDEEMTSGVGQFQPSSQLLNESVNSMLYSLNAPYNSTENLTSCYVTNENSSNTERSPTFGNNVSMCDAGDSFVTSEPEPRTEQQEQHCAA